MRLLAVVDLAALLCTACASSSATLMASRGLTDEERCLLDRGVWRAGHCETCGGGM